MTKQLNFPPKFGKPLEVLLILSLIAIISVTGCIEVSVETDKPEETKLIVKPDFMRTMGLVHMTKNTDIVLKKATHFLRVSRHTSVPFNESKADDILNIATKAAREKDEPDDVECDVSLIRKGSVSTFSDPALKEIETETEFNAVTETPGGNVVKEIWWCNDQDSAFPLGGCSVREGNSFVVASYDNPDMEGILWLHEFGHNKNNVHRDDHETAVMHPSPNANHKTINQAECEKFRTS